MIFGGDFRQISHVVKKGNRSAIVNSSLKHAAFWPDVTKLRLTENMKIKSAGNNQENQAEFAKYLLDIGEGNIENIQMAHYEDEIHLPENIGKNIKDSVTCEKQKNLPNRIFE